MINNFLKNIGFILVVASINTNAHESDLIKNLASLDYRHITIVEGGFVCKSADSYKKLVDYVNSQSDKPSDCFRIKKENQFVGTAIMERYQSINIIKVIDNEGKCYWVAKTLTK
jgi:hypothetical protein